MVRSLEALAAHAPEEQAARLRGAAAAAHAQLGLAPGEAVDGEPDDLELGGREAAPAVVARAPDEEKRRAGPPR